MKLLLGFPQPERGAWPDYASLGITAEDAPALIEIARVQDPIWDDSKQWARVHARRCLGQLRAAAAVEPLLLLTAERSWPDWISGEVATALGMIGPPAFEALRAFAADTSRHVIARGGAAQALTLLAELHPELRGRCVEVLTGLLSAFEQEERFFNSVLTSCLMVLGATGAAPLLKAVYEAGRVDEEQSGDWDDVQIALGLLSTRTGPRVPTEPDPEELADLDAQIDEDLQRDEEEGRAALDRYLGHPDIPVTRTQLRGFFFALAWAPGTVKTLKWVAAIMDGCERELAKQFERDGIISGLEAFRDEVEATFDGTDTGMPDDVSFREDLLANLDDDAEAAQWSRGFLQGHRCAIDAWEPMPSGIDTRLVGATALLAFFGSPEDAWLTTRVFLGENAALEEGAAMVIRAWPGARMIYAESGSTLFVQRKRAKETRDDISR